MQFPTNNIFIINTFSNFSSPKHETWAEFDFLQDNSGLPSPCYLTLKSSHYHHDEICQSFRLNRFYKYLFRFLLLGDLCSVSNIYSVDPVLDKVERYQKYLEFWLRKLELWWRTLGVITISATAQPIHKGVCC